MCTKELVDIPYCTVHLFSACSCAWHILELSRDVWAANTLTNRMEIEHFSNLIYNKYRFKRSKYVKILRLFCSEFPVTQAVSPAPTACL